MQQEKINPNNRSIDQVTTEYATLEPDFQQVKTYRDNLRTQILDYVKTQPDAFKGDKKSHHLSSGVVVRRATKTVNHFDDDKMNSSWLKAILSTPSAVAIKVSIDPKLLQHDEVTDALLSAINYREELQHSYKVDITTVQNQ